MRRPFALALLLIAIGGFTGAEPPPFPHESSDLPPDPAVTWGRLDNGLRYALRPDPNAHAELAVVLLVQVGSYHENDDERGYAHFVEHMAFNGTKRFPGDALIRSLQRHGVALGPHTGATTSPFETTYRITVRATDAQAVSTAFAALRDIAGNVLFARREVVKERGVILSEQRARQAGLGSNLIDFVTEDRHQLIGPEVAVLSADQRLGSRHPIGIRETIEAADATRLSAFYRRWYRPDRMILTVSGSFDVEPTQAVIQREFGSLVRPTTSAEAVPPLQLYAPEKSFAHRFAAPHSELNVSIAIASPFALTPDNRATRQRAVELRAAHALVNFRLDRRVQAGAAPLLGPDLLGSDELPDTPVALVRFATRPDDLPGALESVAAELAAAAQTGFTADELREWQTAAGSYLRREATAGRTPNVTNRATELAYTIARGAVFTDPTDPTLNLSVVEAVTADACQSALAETWSDRPVAIALRGRQPSDDVVREALNAWLNPRSAEPVTNSGSVVDLRTALRLDEQPIGRIRTRESLPEGIERVVFENGVEVRLKANGTQDEVLLALRFGQGRYAEPSDRPGVSMLGSWLFFGGAAGVSFDELQTAFRGRLGDVNLLFEDDGTLLSFDAEPKDLPDLLSLVTALLSAPAYHASGYDQALGFSMEAVRHLSQLQPRMGVVARERFMSGYRAAILPAPRLLRQQLQAITREEATAWIETQRTHGPIVLNLVGNFELEPTIEQLAETVGRLPTLLPPIDLSAQRQVHFPPTPFDQVVTHDYEQRLVVVTQYWPLTAPHDAALLAHADVIRRLIDERLRVRLREQLGATYSPRVWRTLITSTQPTVAYLAAQFETQPAGAKRVTKAMDRELAALQRRGPSSDEFARSLSQAREAWVQNTRSNAFWLEQLQSHDDSSALAARLAAYSAALDSVTPATLQGHLRRILAPEPIYRLIVIPAPEPTKAPEGKGK